MEKVPEASLSRRSKMQRRGERSFSRRRSACATSERRSRPRATPERSGVGAGRWCGRANVDAWIRGVGVFDPGTVKRDGAGEGETGGETFERRLALRFVFGNVRDAQLALDDGPDVGVEVIELERRGETLRRERAPERVVLHGIAGESSSVYGDVSYDLHVSVLAHRARHEMFRHAHLLVTAQIESVVHRVRLERVPEHVSPTDAASEETLLEARHSADDARDGGAIDDSIK